MPPLKGTQQVGREVTLDEQSSHAHSVMLGQANDISVELGAATGIEIQSALKLNCLFFEQSALPIIEIIAGRHFLDLREKDETGIKKLFSEGLLVPQYNLRPDDSPEQASAVVVAERMLADALPSYAPYDQVMSFAEFLDAQRAPSLTIEQSSFKTESRKNSIRSLEDYASKRSLKDHEVKLVKDLVSYAESGEYFSETRAFEIISLAEGTSLQRDLKIIVTSASMYSASILSNLQLSTSGLQTRFVDRLRPTSEKVYGRPSHKKEVFEVEGRFDLDSVLTLPLVDIIELRSIRPFEALRTELSRVRGSGKFSENKLQNMMNECAEVLSEFNAQTVVGRRNFRRNTMFDNTRARIRLTAGVSFGASPLIQFLQAGDFGIFGLITMAGGALLSADSLIPSSQKRPPAVFDNNADYRGVDGTTRVFKK